LMSSMLRIKLALLAGAPVFAAAKKAKQAAAATAATVDDAVDWKSAGLMAAALLSVTLVVGYMIHRNGEKAAAPAPAAAASARSATVTVPTSTVPAPEPVSPFDEARTRRFKRMFQKYSSDDGTISEGDLAKLFVDCGKDVPPSGLQDLLNRYPCRDERDEPGPVKIGFEAFLKMAKHLEDQPDQVFKPGSFFEQIYQKFVSSNNLVELSKEQ